MASSAATADWPHNALAAVTDQRQLEFGADPEVAHGWAEARRILNVMAAMTAVSAVEVMSESRLRGFKKWRTACEVVGCLVLDPPGTGRYDPDFRMCVPVWAALVIALCSQSSTRVGVSARVLKLGMYWPVDDAFELRGRVRLLLRAGMDKPFLDALESTWRLGGAKTTRPLLEEAAQVPIVGEEQIMAMSDKPKGAGKSSKVDEMRRSREEAAAARETRSKRTPGAGTTGGKRPPAPAVPAQPSKKGGPGQ